MAEEKDKLDQVLDEIRSIKQKQQEDGVKLEQLGSNIKGVAEGHAVIRSEMQRGFDEVKQQIGFVDTKVGFLGKKVDRIYNTLNATTHASYGLLTDVQKDVKEVKDTLNKHVRLPAHA
jgi:uncharacterized protein YaaN involved in tellurite resistance